jgi:hypothetical protein
MANLVDEQPGIGLTVRSHCSRQRILVTEGETVAEAEKGGLTFCVRKLGEEIQF